MPLVHELHYMEEFKKRSSATDSCHRNAQASSACIQATSLYCFLNPFLRIANQKAIKHQKGRIELFE